MSLFRPGDVWWYEFWFAGRRIQESSKSPSKTIARTAEQNVAEEFFSAASYAFQILRCSPIMRLAI
jgi:hypothetical protein